MESRDEHIAVFFVHYAEQIEAGVRSRFGDRAHRVVSIDYDFGTSGLRSVKNAIGDELVHHPTGGPLCVYGESAGAHLALLAASQIPSVECVIGIGTPTNLATWPTESNADPVKVGVFSEAAVGRLGPAAIFDPSWSPAQVAAKVNADVLLGMQADDRVLPQQQLADYVSRSPTTRTISIPPGPDPYLHDTIGEEGRATLVTATQGFVDRAIAAHAVKTAAATSRCSGANTTLPRQGTRAFRTATACLASRPRKRTGRRRLVAVASAGASRSTVSVVGAVTPARAIAKAMRTASARRILMDPAARKLSVKVAQAARSRVTFTTR